jgi:asparagine synthase (glutamine-hydrolysing)
MCGIYGMAALSGAPLRYPGQASLMAARLRHRGPDGHGERRLPHVLLGAARLRIQDLSPRGDQPFADPEHGIWLVCNGEIYNAPALRRRFANYSFVSESDVETVIPLYLAGGADALGELQGMFALALWDPRVQTLVLARDRAGEKPLFHASRNGEIWFASEMGPLLDHPAWSRSLDQLALDQYLTLGFVEAPRTLLEHIRSVEPGCIEVHECRGNRVIRYWDPARVVESAARPTEAVERGRALIRAAVTRQVGADVPLGVFTSGGLDSSLVAALTAEGRPEPLHLFTASFRTPDYDESAHAALLARHLDAFHVTVPVDEAGLAEAYEAVATSTGEPLADPAALPTYLLARRARESVGVVLSGEGADELFGGYPAYLGHALAPAFRILPGWIRRTARRAATGARVSHGKVPLAWLLQLFVEGAGRSWPERHVAWIGTGLPWTIRAGGAGPPRDYVPPNVACMSPLSGAMLFDYRGYLGSRLLPKLDRATMAVGLEARAPFLDPGLTEFALGLPTRLKLRGVDTKWLLKRIAAESVPPRIVHRRKRGLSVPIAAWLNGAFQPELDRLLDPARLKRQGLLSDVSVRRLVAEHRGLRANHARALWTLVVLQRWLEHWLPEVG